jgi:pilus assembly protein CpaB
MHQKASLPFLSAIILLFTRGCAVKKNKPIIFIVLTVLVALATSFLVYRWLQEKSIAIANQRGELLNVAVAMTDLNGGTVIRPEMVKTVPFLKGSLASGFFKDTASVVGRVVITPIKADEPIFDSRLAPLDVTKGGVAAVISPNKRAMAVKVDKVKGVSGFIHPGNRVDVVATFRPAYSQLPLTMTVLENILVLATGTETEVRNKQEKPVEVDVITLEVSPEEAEVLALASTEGKLQLSLRNFSDTKNVASKGTTMASLVNLLSGKNTAPAKKITRRKTTNDPPRENYSNVELIEGHKVNEVKFKEGSD